MSSPCVQMGSTQTPAQSMGSPLDRSGMPPWCGVACLQCVWPCSAAGTACPEQAHTTQQLTKVAVTCCVVQCCQLASPAVPCQHDTAVRSSSGSQLPIKHGAVYLQQELQLHHTAQMNCLFLPMWQAIHSLGACTCNRSSSVTSTASGTTCRGPAPCSMSYCTTVYPSFASAVA